MQSFRRFAPFILCFFLSIGSVSFLSAQDSGSGNGNFYLIGMLILIGALILVSAIYILSENYIKMEEQKAGVSGPSGEKTFFSNLKSLWEPKSPQYTNGADVIRLKKGHDILLNGVAIGPVKKANVQRFSVSPKDFREMSPIPKLSVGEGDEVQAGDILFFDKKNPQVKYASPVSGEVVEVRRGAKRSIAEIIILADKEQKFRKFDPPALDEVSREDLVEFLCESGAWPLINQRPYDVVADTSIIPTNVFISTFDSAPLAPDLNVVVNGKGDFFQKGLDTLNLLTEGAVHLGMDARRDQSPATEFIGATNCQKHWFSGKHPVGNVGIQIHHTHPINSKDKVWTLGVQEVITIGKLMATGVFDASRIVAITGSQVKEGAYYETVQGASISELLDGLVVGDNNRIVDGDPLSGTAKTDQQFLGFTSDQLTVIEEGDQYEMFGWLFPITPRPTISRTFPNFLYPNMQFDVTTNTHGEERAFVVTGQYESVLPMDVYPQHLLKSILANDYERMEGLGITELTEEDLALCEFVCTSKTPVQKILRQGLDMMREQG